MFCIRTQIAGTFKYLLYNTYVDVGPTRKSSGLELAGNCIMTESTIFLEVKLLNHKISILASVFPFLNRI